MAFMLRPCPFLLLLALSVPPQASSATHAAVAGAAGCRGMAAAQRKACESRDARARYWAARAAIDDSADDPPATIEELLDLAQAHRYGLASAHASLWQSLRAKLMARSRKFGLPFVAPETSGTPRFDGAVLALTKRYTALTAKQRTGAFPNNRTATATCSVPDASVRIKGPAAEPDYPDIARQQGATGTAIVRVYVDPTGALIAGNIYKSSGNAALDQAAMNAARRTAYLPAYKNCRAVAGDYSFEADFSGQ